MSSVAVSYAHPEDTSKLPGGGVHMRNGRNFQGVMGGPAEQRPVHTHTKHRVSAGGCHLRSCRHFRGFLGGPARPCGSLEGCHLRNSRRNPAVLGGPAGRCSTPKRDLAFPLGAVICETTAAFTGPRELKRSGVLRAPCGDLAAPRGGAACVTVATFRPLYRTDPMGA